MKLRKLFILILGTTFFNSYSQIIFEKGYFIDNNNVRSNCFIKNEDWLNNPKTFDYKLDSLGETSSNSILNVKEFAFTGGAKFIKAIVDIDKSSEKTEELSHHKQPIWNADTVFLKVLIEGKGNLFYYENKSIKRFFYSTDSLPINQLIYKQYVTDDLTIHANNAYLAQLRINLNCSESLSRRAVNFNEKDLKNYVIDYNTCMGVNSIDYDSSSKNMIDIRLQAGFSSSHLKIQNSADNSYNETFNQFVSFSFGFEVEDYLPFNKNRWSLFISPRFHYFNTTGEKLHYEINYKAIEFPAGFKFSFLSEDKKTRISLYPAIVYETALNSKIESNNLHLDIQSRHNFMLGIGFENKRFSFDIKYNINRDILSDYYYYKSSFNEISFMFGYKIF